MKKNLLFLIALFCFSVNVEGNSIYDKLDYKDYWCYMIGIGTDNGLRRDTEWRFHLMEDTVIHGNTYRRMIDSYAPIDSYSKPYKMANYTYVPPMYNQIQS